MALSAKKFQLRLEGDRVHHGNSISVPVEDIDVNITPEKAALRIGGHWAGARASNKPAYAELIMFGSEILRLQGKSLPSFMQDDPKEAENNEGASFEETPEMSPEMTARVVVETARQVADLMNGRLDEAARITGAHGKAISGLMKQGQDMDAANVRNAKGLAEVREVLDTTAANFAKSIDHLIDRVKDIDRKVEIGGGGSGGSFEIHIKDCPEPKKIEGLVHNQFPKLARLVGGRVHTVMVGPAGTGKTTAARQAALAFDLPFTVYRGHRHSTPDEIYGFLSAVDGAYVPGVAFEAFTKGGIFFVDEFDVMTPAAVKAMNNLTDESPVVQFPHAQLTRHKDFVVLLAANTVGQGGDEIYTGASGALDGSSLDRLVALTWDIDEGLERKATLARHPKDDTERWLNRVRAVRAAFLEANASMHITPRASLHGADLLALGFDIDEVAHMVLLSKMTEDQLDLALDVLSGC